MASEEPIFRNVHSFSSYVPYSIILKLEDNYRSNAGNPGCRLWRTLDSHLLLSCKLWIWYRVRSDTRHVAHVTVLGRPSWSTKKSLSLRSRRTLDAVFSCIDGRPHVPGRREPIQIILSVVSAKRV